MLDVEIKSYLHDIKSKYDDGKKIIAILLFADEIINQTNQRLHNNKSVWYTKQIAHLQSILSIAIL